jgi:hypothetical protein
MEAGSAPSPAFASFVSTSGGPACRFDPANTGFIAAPAAYPVLGSSAPHGFFRFKLVGCTPGFVATLTIAWPSLTGLIYTKYGRASASATVDSFFTPSALVVSGNAVTFQVIDGGTGDNDRLVNGEITDPTGPILLPPEPREVSTMSRLMLAVLLCLMLMLVIRTLTKKTVQRKS